MYLSEASGGFTAANPPGASAGNYLWSIANGSKPMKVFYSSDGSATWTELSSANTASNIKSNNATYFGEHTFNTNQALTTSAVVHIGA